MNSPNSKQSLQETLRMYLKPRVSVMLFFGFSAGLPFLLVFSTLTWWLNTEGIAKSTIGFFGWVGMIYSIKVFWSPIIDAWSCPLLGRLGKRRGWILAGQLGVMAGLLLMSVSSLESALGLFVFGALLVGFSSATQDIVIDAFRIESAPDRYQGAMSALYVFGYRIALLVAGGGAILLSNSLPWPQVYQVMAMLMLIGVLTTLWVKEPEHAKQQTDTLAKQPLATLDIQVRPGEIYPLFLLRKFFRAISVPFIEFLQRQGWFAIFLLIFISIYRLSDIAMGIMANPFYQDLGYTETEVAFIVKFFGFAMTIFGSIIGGIIVYRFGNLKPLLIGAILVALTNLIFASLALNGKNLPFLALVISMDNFSGGFSTTAFVAFLSSLVNRSYSATQYALFSSLMTLPGKFVSGFSGTVVESYGYFHFFVYTACLGIPAILIVSYLLRHPTLCQYVQDEESESRDDKP